MEIGEQPLYDNRELDWHPNQRVREVTSRLRVVEREFRSSARWAIVDIALGSVGAGSLLLHIIRNDSLEQIITNAAAVAGLASLAVYHAGRALQQNSEATGLNAALAVYSLNEDKPVVSP